MSSRRSSSEWIERVRSLPPESLEQLRRQLTPRTTPFMRQAPTIPQAEFLLCRKVEALYGGAAGGGKSSALLLAALQYVDVPGYRALLLRRTFADLALPGALMDRAREWLGPTAARWNGQDKVWVFPSGATLTFGYLEHDGDETRYQGAELQFIGFDELTQFKEKPYRYLFSRLRRLKGAQVPLRMRSASNPGGRGHEWVRSRFIDGSSGERAFVPARMDDNPHLDVAEYEKTLAELDPVTREQLRNGDWSARTEGGLFKREWFRIVDEAPAGARRVRRWDFAATASRPGADPDWTVGALVAEHEGRYTVIDVRRAQLAPHGVEQLIRQTAELDGKDVEIYLEQEPGSAGIALIDHYRRHVLQGYAVYADRVTGDKTSRARPVSAAASAGNIDLVRGAWVPEFLDELEAFPGGSHDDQVDALSGAIEKLSSGGWAFV